MKSLDIARQRLHNQHIMQQTFETPSDVVRWLGAVQAQDYAAAKWALGSRLPNVSESDIEQALTTGTILRTHVMRPTWHFVAPSDIRWLLTLTAPHVKAALAYYDRQQNLDESIFQRSNTALAKALDGGKQLTRTELAFALQQSGIKAENGQRLTQLMMHAELDGIICSGARRGKQFTYALLEERVPQTKALDYDEALSECVKRYFTSHGPATIQDFVWWSGLKGTEAKTGLDMNMSKLLHKTIDGQTYWFAEAPLFAPSASPTVQLLPNFDEYTVGYTDRGVIVDASHANKMDIRSSSPLNNVIVLNGQIIGTWKRTLKKDAVDVILDPFFPLNDAELYAATIAVERYGTFLGLAVSVTFHAH